VKDEDLPKVVSFPVDVACRHCRGERRVPGGQREYGEVVDCPVCRGSGTTLERVDVYQLAKLLRQVL
jgi:DnaJ-class molecular chaperone